MATYTDQDGAFYQDTAHGIQKVRNADGEPHPNQIARSPEWWASAGKVLTQD